MVFGTMKAGVVQVKTGVQMKTIQSLYTALESNTKPGNISSMKLIYAVATWLIMGAVIGTGIFLAVVKGSPWLLIVSFAAFVFAVGKIGCAHH
jgi:hypothetical protein